MEPNSSDVTFLYKFVRGVALKSHGGNVAAAAGLPPHIITRAQQMSEEFEQKCVDAMGHKSEQHAPVSTSDDVEMEKNAHAWFLLHFCRSAVRSC
jgi:DNA mismatch repair ATPase MutS